MRKSNLVLIIAVAVLAFFFLAFQAIMHDYIDKVDRRKVVSDFKEEIRTVSSFKRIYNSQDATIYFTQDSITTIKIKGPETYISKVKIRVVGDTLFIDKTPEIRKKDSVKIFISNPGLIEIDMSSGTMFETVHQVLGDKIELHFSNASKGYLDLSYKSVKCKAVSDSKVNIKGNSNHIDFTN